MAATLTDSGELTYLSFGIDKVESTPDGDLLCYGRASDGGVDHDQQIVDPRFSSKAISDWLATGGNVRVQHNAQRDPAGIGLEVNTDESGATWVKSLIIEPVAKRLVAKGALRAYSVGIARPTIERDPTGKARGGIITAGEVVEISIVDRPANARCGIQLVAKSADGTPEYVGKVFGGDAAIAKALGEPETVKNASAVAPSEDLSITFTPSDLARMVKQKFVQQHYDDLARDAAGAHADDLAFKAIADAEADVYKRDIDTATRRRLASEGSALPNLSYPVENASDLQNAATLARSGHGDVAAARRLIARRAKELGVANPLDDDDKVKKSSGDEGRLAGMLRSADQFAAAVDQAQDQAGAQKAADDFAVALKEAEPEVTKDPEPEAKPEPVKKAKKKPKGPKKLPPWLNKPDDEGSDDEKGSSGDTGACKSVTDHLWTGVEGTSDVVCSKCRTTPAEAAGVTASPMDPAPVGELMETPMPASVKSAPTPASASGATGEHMAPVPQHREPDGAGVEPFEKDADLPATGQGETPTRLEAPTLKASPEVLALLRFKSAGIDPDLGMLHDLTCPAYHPDEVAKYHPFADLATLIDEAAWQQKALDAACGPIEHALKMQELVQAAAALKSADPELVNDWRLAAYKAFRDANPGPSSYPTPGAVSPQKYNRPLLTDGREASSPGHAGPNMSPQVATSTPDAHSFDRPPLAEAHASPSPSFMKSGFAYPSQQGVPTQLTYARQQQEEQHAALGRMHTHLASMFPAACPMDMNGRGPQAKHPVPVPAGIGKSEDAVKAKLEHGEVIIPKSAVPAAVAAFKADPEDEGQFADADVYKSFKKMRKKLGKRVLAGKITVDEARAKMGRQFAQKGSNEEEAGVRKSAAPAPSQSERVTYQGAPIADLIKSAVAEALHVESVPLEAATIEAFDPSPAIEAAVTKAVTPLLEKIQQQDTKLAETQRVIDAIADQPDPSTAAFSGLAFNPVRKAARPAGVTEIAEAAARAQRATERELENLYNSSSDPLAREAYYTTLNKMRGVATP